MNKKKKKYVSDEEARELYIHNLLNWLRGGQCDDFVKLYDKAEEDNKLELLANVDILISIKPKKLFFKTNVEAKNPDEKENSNYGRRAGHIRGGPEEIEGTAVTYIPSKNYWILMR